MHSPDSGGWRRLARRSLAAALTLPLLATVAFAKDEPKKPTQKTFQDWTLVCQKPEGADKEICVLVQTAIRKDSDKDNDTGKPVMQIEIGQLLKGEQVIMAVTLPLGVPLAQGVAFQIDGGEPYRVPFQVCTPTGCQAVLPLKDEIISALKGGKEGKVTLNERSQNPASLPVSLKGFSAGYKALQDARK